MSTFCSLFSRYGAPFNGASFTPESGRRFFNCLEIGGALCVRVAQSTGRALQNACSYTAQCAKNVCKKTFECTKESVEKAGNLLETHALGFRKAKETFEEWKEKKEALVLLNSLFQFAKGSATSAAIVQFFLTEFTGLGNFKRGIYICFILMGVFESLAEGTSFIEACQFLKELKGIRTPKELVDFLQKKHPNFLKRLYFSEELTQTIKTLASNIGTPNLKKEEIEKLVQRIQIPMHLQRILVNVLTSYIIGTASNQAARYGGVIFSLLDKFLVHNIGRSYLSNKQCKKIGENRQNMVLSLRNTPIAAIQTERVALQIKKWTEEVLKILPFSSETVRGILEEGLQKWYESKKERFMENSSIPFHRVVLAPSFREELQSIFKEIMPSQDLGSMDELEDRIGDLTGNVVRIKRTSSIASTGSISSNTSGGSTKSLLGNLSDDPTPFSSPTSTYTYPQTVFSPSGGVTLKSTSTDFSLNIFAAEEEKKYPSDEEKFEKDEKYGEESKEPQNGLAAEIIANAFLNAYSLKLFSSNLS